MITGHSESRALMTDADGSKPSAPVFENLAKRSLWTVRETAEFLAVSEATIRDWVYRRVMPFRKAGKSLRFDPQEIEKWTLPKKE